MKKIVLSISSVLFLGIFFLTPLRFDILNTSLSSLFFGPSIGFSIAHADAYDFGDALFDFYKLLIYDLTAHIAAFSGWFLDFFLKHSIASSSYRTGLIESGWEVIRDLVNIAFIFSLIMIAFEKVFGITKSNPNKRLIKTIVVALMMNFSLYGVYLIVDSSNILANLFYNRIIVEGQAPQNSGSDLINRLAENPKSISGALMSNFNPQKIVQMNGTGKLEGTQRFVLYSAAGLLNIAIFIVFFSVAFVFLSRTVGIMLLAVLTPLAVISMVIPGLEGRKYVGFDNWSKQFLGLSFTAPVFLFFLFIIIQFASKDGFISTVFYENLEGDMLSTILSVILPFAFIGILLFFSKKITIDLAGELGGMITGYVMKAAAGVAAVGAIAATGGAAALGGASRLAGAGSKFLTNGEDNAFSRRASSLGKFAQTAKFDLNKIPGFQKQLAGTGMLGTALSRGMNTSYADANTAVRGGINSIRTGIDNTLTGKTPESVKKWQDNVNASNDARINAKAENAARKAQEEAMVADGIVSLDENGKIKRDPVTGKILKESHKGKNTKKLLEEKRTQAARMTEEEKKIEKDNIDAEVKATEERIKNQKKAIEATKAKMKNEKNPTVVAAMASTIVDTQDIIKNLEKDIETIKNSSVEGTIKQIEDQMKAVANTAKANVLKGATDSQAARIQSAGGSSSEKGKGNK
jgi:hypothetical protein